MASRDGVWSSHASHLVAPNQSTVLEGVVVVVVATAVVVAMVVVVVVAMEAAMEVTEVPYGMTTSAWQCDILQAGSTTRCCHG